MHTRFDTTYFRLAGGIGNQLFCVAAARYLAERAGHNVALNTWYLDRYGENHGASVSGRSFPDRFIHRKPSLGKDRRAFLKFFPIPKSGYNSLAHGGWDPGLELVGHGGTVAGYFQSWRYAAALQSPISRNHLLRREGPSLWLREEIERAKQVRPVVLHLRRGDYTKLADQFGMVGSSFIRKSLDHIRQSGINNEIWVFSDDIVAADHMLKDMRIRVRLIKPPAGEDPAESLILMSHGGANIISNSTFSWWGAFLNPDAECVLAPNPWFVGRVAPAELIPPNWVRIEHSF